MNYKHVIFTIVYFTICFYIIYIVFKPRAESYDLIIVGSGLAGLTASIESYKLTKGNLRILLLETDSTYGGNSKKATSGINLLNTPLQKSNNILDSFDLFFNDTFKASKNLSIPSLLSVLVNDSQQLFSYYKEFGIQLQELSILGGHSVPRTHRPSKSPIGSTITKKLNSLITQQTNITVRFNSTVNNLIYNSKSNTVIGVEYYNSNDRMNYKIKSKGVILATGGYAHDFSEDSLLKEFVPTIMKFPTTNGKGSQGQGVKLGRKIGAQLIGMEYVQIHPTGFVNRLKQVENNKILAPELLRGVGGILINQQGNRFCNELGPRDYVTKMIISNCERNKNESIEQYEAFLVLNRKGVDEYGESINFYFNNHLLEHYNDFSSFAIEFHIPINNLNKTIEEYNLSYNKGNDAYGKTFFPTSFNFGEEVFGGIVTPSIHYTMGGLKINEKAEVINKEGNVIKGLYGAGEVTGGVHGGNRLGGNSLSECGVFGRKAAQSAISFIYQ